jgi:diguanylate cyclase (GGDEF)-like protein
MATGTSSWWKTLFDTGDATSTAGRALLQARYASLQRQIPLVYLLVCANYVGLYQASEGQFTPELGPGFILLVIIVARLVHWVMTSRRTLAPERIQFELKRTIVLAFVISVGFCAWAMQLFGVVDEAERYLVVLFVGMTCIGCAHGLSSLPSAARIPLVCMAMPFTILLIATGGSGMTAAGISLGIATLISLRMLHRQHTGFSELVRSRTEIALERERAEAAQRRAVEEQDRARTIAATDPLTCLPNRRALLDAMGRLGAGGGHAGTIAMVDLDGFKPINDTFGHASGDAVLKQVGTRLRAAAGEGGFVARMGGDEFAILLPHCADAEAASAAGQAICAALGAPMQIYGRELRLTGSCGLAILESAAIEPGDALARGDTALYTAKQKGRGRWALFEPSMQEGIRRRSRIEQSLRDPRLQEQIMLLFQPIYDLATGRLRAFEALARWNHPDLGPLSPAEFIPLAEQMNVVEELTEKLFAKAALETRLWPEHVSLSFNISAVQLCSLDSPKRLLKLLRRHDIDPARLQVEVTETALLTDLDLARQNLQALGLAGIRIILDDFGAGYASISYLREMQFDAIKIDGALLRAASTSETNRRLLKGVLDLCTSIGVPCIAEHIETVEQRDLVASLGCRDGQGYLLSPPVTADAARRLAKGADDKRAGRRAA